MGATQPLHRHLVVSSSDVDRVVSAGSTLFSPHRLRCRAVDASLAAMELDTVTLISMQYGGDSIVEPSDPLDYYAVHVPLNGHGIVRFSGEQIETGPNTAVVFSPRDEPKMRWAPDLLQIAFTVPADAMRTHLTKLTARSSGRPLVFSHSAPSKRSVATDGWINTVRMVFRTADAYRQRPLPIGLRRSLEDMLLTSLLMTQPNNWTDTLYSGVPSAAPHAVALAIEMIEAEPEDNWSLARLAAETGVSARSLQEGFRRAKGMPPMTYVKNARLDLVRRRLEDPLRTGESISDIAFDAGFTHLGRFSSAFRERFGIKPSELRRTTSHRT
ncbi:AraC family transcriptional regulator [Rhodococcus sp. C26F]